MFCTDTFLQQTSSDLWLDEISLWVMTLDFYFITAVCFRLALQLPIKGILLQHKGSVVTDTDSIFFVLKLEPKAEPQVILGRGMFHVSLIPVIFSLNDREMRPLLWKCRTMGVFSPARLWDPAYVLSPGWRGRLCHRKCSHRGPPNLAPRSDRPPSSDSWRHRKRSIKQTPWFMDKMEAQNGLKSIRVLVVGCTWGSSWSCSQTALVWGCLWAMLHRLHNMRSYKKKGRKHRCGWAGRLLLHLHDIFQSIVFLDCQRTKYKHLVCVLAGHTVKCSWLLCLMIYSVGRKL